MHLSSNHLKKRASFYKEASLHHGDGITYCLSYIHNHWDDWLGMYWFYGGEWLMNWVDVVVVLCVALAILAVIFYKLYPLLFKKKKVSRKANELIKDYKKAKKKEGK